MARPHSLHPKYCHDKTSGKAYVVLSGRKHTLGPFGSRKSQDKYSQLIGEWIGSGRAPLPKINPHDAGASLTVTTLISEWQKWARPWYGAPAVSDGRRPAGELGNYWDVLRELRRLHGEIPAATFTPKLLKEFAAALASDREFTDARTGAIVKLKGLCRNVVNRHLSRVKSVFRWGTEQEPPFVSGEVFYRLAATRGLQIGRGQARETDAVQPVPEKNVFAVLPYLTPHLAAMAELQLITAMRPGEVCGMRWMEIDTTSEPFEYRPAKHKTAHKGKKRIIPLGGRAMELLNKFPAARLNPTAYMFSPAQAEAHRLGERRAARTTPMTPSQIRRAEIAASRQRQRPPGERYRVATYRKAIERACEKAFGMPAEFFPDRLDSPEQKQARAENRRAWHRKHKFRPNQLRHAGATKTRRLYGLDAAQQLLGHATRRMTENYAQPDFDLARRVAKEIG